MKVLKPLLAILLLLCLVAAGLLTYLHFADLNAYRPRIEAAVTETVGRQLRIEGNVDLNLWPELQLAVNDLHLANAAWGSEPEMARLGHFSLRVKPLSVFRGPLRVLDLQLADVDILVETNPGGESNWALPDAQPAAGGESRAPEGGGLAIWLDQASVERVRVRQREAGTERDVSVATLLLEANPQGELELSGQGEVLSLPLLIAGRVGPMLAFEQGGALDFELSLNLGETRLVLDGKRSGPGSLRSRLELSGLQPLFDHLALPLSLAGESALDLELREQDGDLEGDLDGRLGEVTLAAQFSGDASELAIEGSISSLDGLARIFALQGLPGESLAFSTSLGLGDELSLRQFDLSAGATRLSASGRVGGARSGSLLQVELNGERAADWLADLPELPFALSADLDLAGNTLQADSLHLALGASDLQGSVQVAMAEAPTVTLDLRSTRLDLVQLTGAGSAGQEATGAATAQARAAAGKKPSKSSRVQPRYVFTDAPLPLEVLQDKDIDTRWRIDELVLPALTLESIDLVASLHGGRLLADTTFAGALGGAGKNHLEIVSHGEDATLVVSNRLRELRVNLASGEVDRASDIPPLDLTLDLSAAGASARAMAESSEGNILLTLGPGLLTNSVMERFSGDILSQLLTALNPFAKSQEHMALQCGVVGIGVESGVAELEPLLLQTDKLQVIAGGDVDLNTEKLNIEFNTKPRSGVGVSADMFVTPFVSLEGTLAKPGVGLNESSTLLTAGAAMATGGMSILWKGMLDRATGAVDHCKRTLKEYRHPAMDGEVRPPD